MTENRANDSPRDNSAWNRDRFSAWDSDERALRAARTEARESLEETIDSIHRIDESAMTALRIDLLIAGLSLTAASSFQYTWQLINELTVLGFVGVSLSAVVAVVTTLGSKYPTGVSAEYIDEFQRSSWSEREWNEWMVREYCLWLSEANEMVEGEARGLFYTQTLLGAGLLLLIGGIVFGTAGVVEPIPMLEPIPDT
ncbi:hypothetical protein NGM10_09775 [Halorussus salilacus]|uniref:hypothetical protein n=1 Tax=Halorussus salilacus TaxID=2953750 RepID=UPI0020A09411|nr:hypothetical protein [Halorussus salilacus]USZ67017.1 hypothetical protein NGM10_09775 [Halorussus salilacus]